jgi:molybdenum cofactor synthesis domain-containing protein
MLKFSLCVVTSTRNKDTDLVAPKLSEYLKSVEAQLELVHFSKDSIVDLQNSLKYLSAQNPPIIIFAGGTGLTSDDVTPEALEPMYQRKLPGFDEAMRMANFTKIPGTILSRGVSGIYNQKIVLSMPGSPKAVVENLSVVFPVLDHAVKKLADDKTGCI